MMANVYVIDTSGFIVGMEFTDRIMVTVPKVHDEILDSTTKLRFDLLCDRGLRVERPHKTFLERVRSAAVSCGDECVLSRTDMDILAKALEYKKEYDVILITDDYAVQNVASSLGINYRSAGSIGIKSRIVWKMKCTGCGAVVKSGNECPICGSGVKRYKIPH
jgi:UPF0271 protein